MAPRIRVPANFGTEHMNSEVHGNLILKLKDGGQIKTNSMIMSLNSPVIDNLTTNLHQSTLEVDDFTNGAVDCFVESLYSGDVEKLERNIFEEVNKMAHVFEVSWLSKRCLKFYQTDILNFEKNTYDEILLACEVASRAHTNLKQSKYVSYFVKTAASWNIGKSIFLQRYMADFAQLSKRQIDMSFAIARNDMNLVVSCLICHLSVAMKSKDFDENSLYLLEKLDARKFVREYPSYFKELAYFITEISEISSIDGIKPILEKFSQVKASSGDEIHSSENSQHENLTVESDNSDSEEFNEFEDHEFKNIAIQTDTLDEAGWKLLQNDPEQETTILLPRQELIALEMVTTLTTKNDVGKFITFGYTYSGDDEEFNVNLSIRCNDVKSCKWCYALSNCTTWWSYQWSYWPLLKNVPVDEVKLWKITKTTTHMKIVCNDVTVLNFNYETDSIQDYQNSKDKWSGQPKFVNVVNQFSELTFVRAI